MSERDEETRCHLGSKDGMRVQLVWAWGLIAVPVPRDKFVEGMEG